MNWYLVEELAKQHLDALQRAAGDGRPRWEKEPRQPGRIRRAIGVRFVSAGLGLAAGLRAARTASEVVCNARDLASEGS
ncbi:MAG TPA: hypothetical protein VJ818_05090 [Actinomycetota bacterium]|nr:hypothetical protein [Actinomycetota bacterium]